VYHQTTFRVPPQEFLCVPPVWKHCVKEPKLQVKWSL